MASQFSGDLKYFAQLTIEGKLKIWNTERNKLEQEFTPDYHLTSPCICLHFVQPEKNKKGGSPKRQKRLSANSSASYIALGTRSGNLLIYSLTKGDLDFTIDGETKKNISCLSWHEGVDVYSASDHHVICFNLENKSIKSKWQTGKENISSILIVPGGYKLLTASKTIKLWDVLKKELLHTFTGHSNDVCLLRYVVPGKSDAYVISGAKNDKLLSCWNLSGTSTQAVANYLMEGIVSNVSIGLNEDSSTSVAAVTNSGICHVYKHTLNGGKGKPIKPTTTVQVVSDTKGKKDAVTVIPIVSAAINSDSLHLLHGTSFALTFERVKINPKEKIQCLVRSVTNFKSTNVNKTNVETPDIVNVDYINSQIPSVTKRKLGNDSRMEISMEKQLEQLQVNKSGKGSKMNTKDVSHLLVQGLHSGDSKILAIVFGQTDENVVRNTISKLPKEALLKLIPYLATYIQGRTGICEKGAMWLKNLLQIRSSVIASSPSAIELLHPISANIETRLALSLPMYKLQGRLNLLEEQILQKTNIEDENESDSDPLIYDDKIDGLSNTDIDDVMETVELSETDEEYEDSDDTDDDNDVVMENGKTNSDDEDEMET